MTQVYKIIATQAWLEAQSAGLFEGAAIDIADGFIHLSDASQAEKTAALHFAGQPNLSLVCFDATHLGDSLKWEPSRGGALFPHVYGPINPNLSLWVKPLPWNGISHTFPEGWNS